MSPKRHHNFVPLALGEFAKVLQPQSGVNARNLSRQSTTSLFEELKTLESLRIPFRTFQPIFGVDKYNPSAAFQRFLQLNKQALTFLEITANYEDDGATLVLTSSRYVGCVPIKSPVTGKVVSNLSVTGRFNEDISELLSIIGDTILPEFSNDLNIIPNELVKPPLYFECANFIDKYLEALHTNWRKFDSRLQIERKPTSGTDWIRYAARSANPRETLLFPNHTNFLSNDHPEWCQLNYVLNLAIVELEAPRTSQRTKAAYAEKISRLKALLGQHATQKTTHLHPHFSDPLVIKDLKDIGNIILNDTATDQKVWGSNPYGCTIFV